MNQTLKLFLTSIFVFQAGFLQGCSDNSSTPTVGKAPEQEAKNNETQNTDSERPSRYFDEETVEEKELYVSEQRSTNDLLDKLSSLGLDFAYDKDSVKAVFKEKKPSRSLTFKETLNSDIERLNEITLLLKELNKSSENSKTLRESTQAVQKSLEDRLELLEKLSDSYEDSDELSGIRL